VNEWNEATNLEGEFHENLKLYIQLGEMFYKGKMEIKIDIMQLNYIFELILEKKNRSSHDLHKAFKKDFKCNPETIFGLSSKATQGNPNPKIQF
jgi:hypothetical protein